MSQFGTHTDVLAQAAARVEQVNGEIQAQLRSLSGMVAGTAGFWRGDTQRTFTALMERWHSDAARLTDALGGIASALAQTGTAYATTEESSTAALRSSGSGLSL
jgi:WXG100 family type VII secretion target